MAQCPYTLKCNQSRCGAEFCIRRTKLDELYKASGLADAQKVRIALDADPVDYVAFTKLKQLEDNITEFVKQGFNLYLHSANTGNSKTTWSIRMVQSYFSDNWAKLDLSCHVLFISIPSYLIALKRNMNTPDEYALFINKNVYDADLVIWDDIGTKFASEYDIEQLFNILNRRIQNGKANIFTSNLSDIELVSALGTRLASRISQGSINIELFGQDKRSLKYKNLFTTDIVENKIEENKAEEVKIEEVVGGDKND